jgi:hypothetical protein
MNTSSDLLVHPIVQMTRSQFFHTTTDTQATQCPSQNLQINIPYIGGQSSMGDQPLDRWKPSFRGKMFTGGEPIVDIMVAVGGI